MRVRDPLEPPSLSRSLEAIWMRLGPTCRLVGQVGAVEPIAADRVAARAPVLDDPLIARLELLGLGNVGHLGVALHTARLDEPLGEHRKVPVMDLVPVVLLVPLFGLLTCVGRVRGISEVGPRTLTSVADRAAEAVDGMRTVGVEIEARRDDLAARGRPSWRRSSKTGASGTPRPSSCRCASFS